MPLALHDSGKGLGSGWAPLLLQQSMPATGQIVQAMSCGASVHQQRVRACLLHAVLAAAGGAPPPPCHRWCMPSARRRHISCSLSSSSGAI